MLDLENSKVVNSIGVSILIEVIEKIEEIEGKLGTIIWKKFIVEKTFKIMGISNYSTIFQSKDDAISEFSSL